MCALLTRTQAQVLFMFLYLAVMLSGPFNLRTHLLHRMGKRKLHLSSYDSSVSVESFMLAEDTALTVEHLCSHTHTHSQLRRQEQTQPPFNFSFDVFCIF